MTATTLPQNTPSAESRVETGRARVELEAAVHGCAIYDLNSRAYVSLTGTDRIRWLNGMVTNNVRDLSVGHGVYAFLLNPQGHILGDLYAYNRGDSLLLEIERTQLEKILQVFDRYIIMDDVEVTVSNQIASIGICGPESRGVLNAVGIGLPELDELQFADLPWHDGKITVMRGGHQGFNTYELLIEPAKKVSSWEALINAHAVPIHHATLELLRIASGLPRYGADIRERDLPQETEQARALNFNKGCYIGQEIVERIRSRGAVHRKFAGFYVDGQLPAPGSKIQLEGKEVGEITSSAILPAAKTDVPVALGYIRREAAILAKRLACDGASLEVAALPFSTAF
jgi:folate-binding protein YgfZ